MKGHKLVGWWPQNPHRDKKRWDNFFSTNPLLGLVKTKMEGPIPPLFYEKEKRFLPFSQFWPFKIKLI